MAHGGARPKTTGRGRGRGRGTPKTDDNLINFFDEDWSPEYDSHNISMSDSRYLLPTPLHDRRPGNIRTYQYVSKAKAAEDDKEVDGIEAVKVLWIEVRDRCARCCDAILDAMGRVESRPSPANKVEFARALARKEQAKAEWEKIGQSLLEQHRVADIKMPISWRTEGQVLAAVRGARITKGARI